VATPTDKGLHTTLTKPYPFVFGRPIETSGIGLSGPGGLLWPLYPPVKSNILKERIGSIPSPSILPSFSISNVDAHVGEVVSVDLNFVLNHQQLLLGGDFGLGAKVYMVDSNFYDIAIVDVDMVDASLITPIIYVVFAFDPNSTGNLDNDDIERLGAVAVPTLPLDVLIALDGSWTNSITEDNRINRVYFLSLIHI